MDLPCTTLGGCTCQGLAVKKMRYRHRNEKAVAENNPDALYGLGGLYLKKYSPSYDPQKAVKYLLEAAKRKYEYAQFAICLESCSIRVNGFRRICQKPSVILKKLPLRKTLMMPGCYPLYMFFPNW